MSCLMRSGQLKVSKKAYVLSQLRLQNYKEALFGKEQSKAQVFCPKEHYTMRILRRWHISHELRIQHFMCVFMRHNFPKRPGRQESVITNLDSSSGQGMYWVCFRKSGYL